MKFPDISTWNVKTKQETAILLEQAFNNIYGESRTNPHDVINEESGKTDNFSQIRIFASPARINIIGEHIDYNGGKVFPSAIDKYLFTAIRKRTDNTVVYNDLRFPGEYRFRIDTPFEFSRECGYCNYLNGIITILKEKGCIFDTGFDVLFFSTIPDGGGLSSSSALECGFGWALSETFGFNIDRITMAKIGQMTEHRFMNVKCGIMDQFSIIMGKKDNAILLDCETLDYKYVPLVLGDYRFVIMNTNKKRQLTDSKYNERFAECMEGLRLIQNEMTRQGLKPIKNLCSLSTDNYLQYKDILPNETIWRRVRHAVTENQRVLDSVKALQNGNIMELGRLMVEAHISMRDDYEATGMELDTLFEQALKVEGCTGARMTGAGFGGCAIALVHKNNTESFIEKVGIEYEKRIGYKASFIQAETGSGTHEVFI